MGLKVKKGGDLRLLPVNKDQDDAAFPTEAKGFEGGVVWYNSRPLTIRKLKGRVLLVEFWTSSCASCLRDLPNLKLWWEKFRDEGLVMVGIHTPEFEFEKDRDRLKKFLKEKEISWPVVQDDDYKIWKAYHNKFWPHRYLIDKKGMIVYDYIGEGGYRETEKMIRRLLAG